LDVSFPRNPKILALLEERDGYRAAVVYICSLAYVGEQGTDGFVPREALRHIHGRQADAARLTAHRLWVEQPGGWDINDWAEFQESTDETRQRRIRAQAGAAARWDGHEPMSNAERTRRWRERQASNVTSNVTSNGT
jgi:hypothetical protein